MINSKTPSLSGGYAIPVFVAWILLCATVTMGGNQSQTDDRESAVKAAYIYNFLQFGEWPRHKSTEAGTPIRVAVVGDKAVAAAFGPISDERIDGRPIEVSFHSTLPSAADYGAFHIIYINNPDHGQIRLLTEAAGTCHVLTISDQPQFAARGGMVEFVSVNNNLRFIINKTALYRAGLQIPAQVFRVAEKVL